MSFDFTFTPSRGPDRSTCVRQAREVMEIVERGGYTAPSGRSIAIAEDVRDAIERTVEHEPRTALPGAPSRNAPAMPTRTSVVNGTSLASAQAIAEATGKTPLVLNFASAKNPGGGFLNGARAQEESLARCSALYACIEGRRMYAHHRAEPDCMYTHWAIWSPDVPVFRDDASGDLLERPYPCTFLTAPAPNAGVVLQRDPGRAAEVEHVLRERVSRVLAIARAHGETHLVLGAWGCGVFQNDPVVVADAFRFELDHAFRDAFEEVVFAVLDWREDRAQVRPFVERFA